MQAGACWTGDLTAHMMHWRYPSVLDRFYGLHMRSNAKQTFVQMTLSFEIKRRNSVAYFVPFGGHSAVLHWSHIPLTVYILLSQRGAQLQH